MIEERPSVPSGARSLRPRGWDSSHPTTPVEKLFPSLRIVIAMFGLSSILWAQTVDLEHVQALASSGDLAGARLVLTRAVEANPRSPQLWAMLGGVCAGLEDWPAARDAYERALRQTPDNPELLAGLGFVLARQGQLQKAIDSLRKSSSLDPGNARVRFLLGRVQFEAQQFDAAVSNFEQAILAEPENEFFYLEYAQILTRGQAYSGAEKILEYGLQQLPRSSAIRFELGVSYQKQLKSRKAQQEFRRVIQLDANFPGVYAALAGSFLESGQLEEAEPVLQNALKINDGDFDSRYLYAVLLSQLGKKAEAVAQLRKCLALRPDDVRVHYLLGKTLAESGEIEAAESALNAAVRLDSEFKEAHLELGRLYSRQGLTEKAGRALRRFEELRQKQERQNQEESDRILIVED